MAHFNGTRHLISYPRTGRNWHRKVFHREGKKVEYSHGDGDWYYYGSKLHKFPPSPEEMKVDFNDINDKLVVLLLRCPKDTFISNYFAKNSRTNC